MIDKKVDYKKVEVVNTYYEGTITDYRVLCDRCKEEIKDGEKEFELEVYDDVNDCIDCKTYCSKCLKEAFDEWMEDPVGSFEINTYIVNNSDYIGKTDTLSENIYELFKKRKQLIHERD